MKNIILFEEFLSDDSKFMLALKKTKQHISKAYETEYDDNKKADFKEFVKNNNWIIPNFFTYKDGIFSK